MIVVSKFSSLYLGRKVSWKAPFDQDVCYYQKFAIGEEIRIQFVGFTDGFTAKYTNDKGITKDVEVETLYVDKSDYDGRIIYELAFSIDTEGAYQLQITNGTDEVTAIFYILPTEELEDTILISYTHRRNEYGTIFKQDDKLPKVFNFRIEGGFYPGDKVQVVENSTFRDQRFNLHQTAADSYEISTLTLGTKKGVPQWVGSKVNSIFNLSDVMIDGIETTRNEASIPEILPVSDYYPLYVFKLKVEQPNEDRVYAGDRYRIFTPSYTEEYK